MGERNGGSGGGPHRCPFGNPRCGRWRRFLPFGPWFCSRCCELINTAAERALEEGELQELVELIVETPAAEKVA